MAFKSLADLLEVCNQKNQDFKTVVLENDCKETGMTREDSIKQMTALFDAMLFAHATYNGKLRSTSGLAGGDGQKLENYMKEGTPLSGEFLGKVMKVATQMGESNACMQRIVAAPTGGSCGVLPAVLIPMFQEKKATQEQIIDALYVASGIGQVIASRASISGAQGGCQAEIGTASSMAAGALVFIKGGSKEMVLHAAGIALQNLLGLACDPVAGLVEIPCINRNALGAANAYLCADMALAGMETAIPIDQIIDAMKDIGDKMHPSLKETGTGGLAATEKGLEIKLSLENE
ncbi:MAG: L-serine ammonia-lyase, iron-sulfur-dependent, subunit alpha [Lachnospiraceae bacterium]|nr:L-serine ammonia-lyase, iron-sulfur-dependent, subunit alpha [Lachnospiraceae bacterium]